MKRLYFSLTIIFISAILLMAGSTPAYAAGNQIPTTNGYRENSSYAVFLPAITSGNQEDSVGGIIKESALDQFIGSVVNGEAEILVGVYAEETLAMPVVQQPTNNAGWISSAPNTITQFAAASNFDVTGLLAHNTHAGAKFYDLTIGEEISLVYGDGSTLNYRVESIRQFQALEPTNPYSDFIDLETNERLTATQLFYQVYTGDHHVTFQTCLEYEGDYSWGRTFIIATPIY